MFVSVHKCLGFTGSLADTDLKAVLVYTGEVLLLRIFADICRSS